MGMTRSLSLVLSAASLAASSVSAQILEAQAGGQEQSRPPEDVAAQAAASAEAIRSNIGDRVNTASAVDLEGFIIFVVDQGTYSDEVIDGASNISAQTATGNFAKAIENARAASKKKRRGTGAINQNAGGLGIGAGTGNGGDFPAPGIGTGGGGTNYTS
ncbi:hypothetical protein OY671_009623 [Metschnikowia pulcherrima]|nr:hypothetical protein OY671_009623 [Metschnikowia pulcherrima]